MRRARDDASTSSHTRSCWHGGKALPPPDQQVYDDDHQTDEKVTKKN